MNISYSLNLEQTQKLIMTPELRQAIMVLQLSAAELVQYIENAMMENPLLEVPEEAEGPVGDEGVSAGSRSEDFISEWCDYLSECGQFDRTLDLSWSESDEGERSSFEHYLAQSQSLQEYLTLQLHLMVSDPEMIMIGEFLIGNINDQGYLQIALEEVQKVLGRTMAQVEKALKVIQGFDPPGVGARNLAECLLIQLEQRGQRTSVMEKLVCCYLKDLANGKLQRIAGALGLTVQEVQQKADLIKSLDPKPGRNLSFSGETRYIIPDVIVEKVEGEYLVLVNDTSVPHLIINKTYQSILKHRDSCDRATTEFIENKLKSAIWLIRSIEQRRLTLYRVAQCIVDYQREFLDHGVKHLRPLTLRQIAAMADLHESTVSRAIANKYIQTPQGVFELKFFFNSGVENILDGEMVAAESIKRMLRELVENEDPCKPLSDQLLCEILKSKGINIARRTVAKYRQEIGILPVRQRKRYA